MVGQLFQVLFSHKAQRRRQQITPFLPVAGVVWADGWGDYALLVRPLTGPAPCGSTDDDRILNGCFQQLNTGGLHQVASSRGKSPVGWGKVRVQFCGAEAKLPLRNPSLPTCACLHPIFKPTRGTKLSGITLPKRRLTLANQLGLVG